MLNDERLLNSGKNYKNIDSKSIGENFLLSKKIFYRKFIILFSMQIEAFDSIILLVSLKKVYVVIKEINVRPE
jgi:hypothetical protein